MKKFGLLICSASLTVAILILPGRPVVMADPPTVAEAEAIQMERIARLIFHNECGGREACLTTWNKGEAFASLGIGHFIWYPQGTPESGKHFSESFPKLIHFMRQQRVEIPAWIRADKGCPWPDRTAFENAQKSRKMINFRYFLIKTMPFQAVFMQNRLKKALPLILTHVPEDWRSHIRRQFERVETAPMGMYALMDYVNFKGEGVNPKERYQSQGWGLLQVLEHMQGTEPGMAAIKAFAVTADRLLTRRVARSPPERHESRWLPGWRKRLMSYAAEAQKY
ncbi:MAG: hypothetical protein Q9M27_05460 [Mariprofundaceae bacterium]|nr:hypothetical protein [Mariprofundaceae bacterium]